MSMDIAATKTEAAASVAATPDSSGNSTITPTSGSISPSIPVPQTNSPLLPFVQSTQTPPFGHGGPQITPLVPNHFLPWPHWMHNQSSTHIPLLPQSLLDSLVAVSRREGMLLNKEIDKGDEPKKKEEILELPQSQSHQEQSIQQEQSKRHPPLQSQAQKKRQQQEQENQQLNPFEKQRKKRKTIAPELNQSNGNSINVNDNKVASEKIEIGDGLSSISIDQGADLKTPPAIAIAQPGTKPARPVKAKKAKKYKKTKKAKDSKPKSLSELKEPNQPSDDRRVLRRNIGAQGSCTESKTANNHDYLHCKQCMPEIMKYSQSCNLVDCPCEGKGYLFPLESDGIKPKRAVHQIETESSSVKIPLNRPKLARELLKSHFFDVKKTKKCKNMWVVTHSNSPAENSGSTMPALSSKIRVKRKREEPA